MAETTVTPDLVREVIKTSLSDSEIEGSISTALVLYERFLGSRGLGESLQIEIKRYLAANFVSIKDQATVSTEEKIGDASIKFASPETSTSLDVFGLSLNRWGRVAIVLDPTGILKSLGNITPTMYAL